MTQKMEIKIGYGIGDFLFGIKREDAFSLLGEPDVENVLNENTDNPRVEWVYNKEELTLRFYDAEDGRLAWIESENKNLTLFDEFVIGKEENEVIELLKANGFQDYEREEYGSFNILDYEDNWLELECTYNRVRRVKLGAHIDKKDKYIWKC